MHTYMDTYTHGHIRHATRAHTYHTRHSHELQIDSGAPVTFYFRLVLESSCIVNAPRST